MRARQIELVYQYARTAMAAAVVAAVSVFFVFLHLSPPYVLVSWMAAFAIIYGIRYLEVFRFFHHGDRRQHTHYWYISFIITTALAGILWGLTGFILIPPHIEETSALLYTSMALLYTCGLAAGALATYTIQLSSYLSFALPCLLLPGVGLLLSQNDLKNTMGLLVLIFAMFLVLLALRINRTLSAALEREVENSRLLRELQQERDKAEDLANRMQTLSTQDSLTGIANRRHMDEFLVREWQRAIRLGEPVSLILADLDFFKAYNDVYGHPAGDTCLRRVAQVLHQHSRRASDLATRYGGEEFAIILADTDADAAWQLAESMRQSVEALQIPHMASKIADHITMSFGITTIIPRHQDEIEDFIKCADRALYRAKADGRNCIVNSDQTLADQRNSLDIQHWDELQDGPLDTDNLYRKFTARGYRCMVQNHAANIHIGRHAHIRDEINLILNGEMGIKADRHHYRLKRGDYISIPGRFAHEVCTEGEQNLSMLIAVREDNTS